MDAVVVGSGNGRRRVWQALAWLVATAAAVAIAVSIYVASQPGRPKIAIKVPRTRPSTQAPGGIPPGATSSDRAVARNSVRPPTARRGPARAGFPHFPTTGYGATLADMATSSIPQAVERIEEVERYAPGIRPIRISFAVLWNALWRSIPGFGGEAKDPEAWSGGLDARRLV